jgi:hypothetical protein
MVRGEVADFGWIGRENWKTRRLRILGSIDRVERSVERCAGLWLAGLFGGASGAFLLAAKSHTRTAKLI